MGAAFENGRRINDRSAHLRRGRIHHGESGAESVCTIDHTAVHALLRDLCGDLLHIGAVAENAGGGQRVLVQTVVAQDFLGVLAHRYIAVPHRHQDRSVGEPGGHIVKALNILGIPIRDHQDYAVLQQIHTAVRVHKVQPLGVHLGGGRDIQLIHLFLTR